MPTGFSKHNYDNKPALAFYERGPGPAGYYLPPLVGRRKHGLTHRINPEYSFGLKSKDFQKDQSPGSGAYQIPQHLKTNGYFAGYKYTIRQKFPIIDKRVTPAPNLYSLPPTDKYRHKAPTHYLAFRSPLLYKKVSPGPSAYLLPPCIGPKIPDKLAAAECTLKGTRKAKEPPISPGPIYDISYKRKGGFTIRKKWEELSRGYDAGPASYNPLAPKCPCTTPKGWSLGIRYNDFTGIFRTQCDGSRYEPVD